MAATLGGSLAALGAQEFPIDAYEVLVVDNGSRDDSRTVAARFPVRLIEEPRRGAAAARNRGIEAAAAQIVAFTDADCVPSRTWLRDLDEGFADGETTVVAGALFPLPGGSRAVTEYVSRIGQYNSAVTLAHPRFPYASTANVAVRASVLEAVGGFDDRFTTYEGVDLFYRLHRQGRLRARALRRAVVFFQPRRSVYKFALQNFYYGRGYARFCVRHRDDLEPHATRAGHHVRRWWAHVRDGRALARGIPDAAARRRLWCVHAIRETALLLGILTFRA
jgi:GT2 family glycosyltransferase